jgi:peptidoglycan lytic transglycosylase
VGTYHLNHPLVLLAVTVIILKATPTNVAFAESGVASVYSTKSGNRTASGQPLNLSALTAAHRSLAFGTQVRVYNPKNGRSVDVTINDRGPFVRGRIIDVTPAAARELGFSGLAPVTLEPKVATTPAAADFRR